MSIMAELKEATYREHDALERALEFLTTDVSVLQYVRTIEGFYGYYEPLEKRLHDISGLSVALDDLHFRRKVPLLQRDLLYWRRDERTIPRCSALPRFDDLSDALGSLYVLEGATLGGRILSRHLLQHLGIAAHNGGAFFAGYGEQTRPMWTAFGQALGAIALETPQRARIIESARTTFRTLHTWCMENSA